MTLEAAIQPRAMCSRCRRPQSVCYCAALPRLETTTKIVILQHPRERDMPIGTARMASLCLPAAELHVGVRWDEHGALARALSDPDRPPILLYPGPGARNVLEDPPQGPVTLVVVDGTWSQAKTIVRDNPVLRALPRYAFDTPEPSQYRIRREPRAEYCSTIEALMHVLGALEGEPARFRSLLDPFRAMIDNQLACQERSPRRRVRQPRPPRREAERLPPEIAARWDDLVCVVGEANAWPYRAGVAHPPEELVHWVAYRVATGEVLEHVVAPQHELSPSTTFHSELPEDVLRAGSTRAQLFERLARFLRPTDVLCSWGHYSLNLAIDSGAPLGPIVGRAWIGRKRPLGGHETPAARSDVEMASESSEPSVAAGRSGSGIIQASESSEPSVAAGRSGSGIIQASESSGDGVTTTAESSAGQINQVPESSRSHGESTAESSAAQGHAPPDSSNPPSDAADASDATRAPDAADALGGHPRLDVRAYAHKLLHRKLGSLEAYAETIGPTPAPVAIGRAGRRAAMLAQILRAWRELATR